MNGFLCGAIFAASCTVVWACIKLVDSIKSIEEAVKHIFDDNFSTLKR